MEKTEEVLFTNYGKNFGEAIAAMKEGKRVCRDGWNGAGLFVYMQVPSVIDKEVVPKMQSLPQFVKDEFALRFASGGCEHIQYSNQMCIVYPDNRIFGWAPSASDSLANDWIILD